jgi:threonine synthase
MGGVAGWRCACCGALVDIATVHPWRCPRAGDEPHHVLRLVRTPGPLRIGDDDNPFLAADGELAWASFAEAHGMTASARRALVVELDDAVAAVAGTGFRTTPFERADALSDALGFETAGGVWIKDETGNVAGSHKARHLFGILLHLRSAEILGLTDPRRRAHLAIASCGNAALAAATLAAALRWPLSVHVPPDADPVVLERLHGLGATVVACPRRTFDPPGDPCILRFREAVAEGAVPFSVQGPENALCLDGGRTLGFEILRHGPRPDRIFVQVGGGALVTGIGDAFVAAAAPTTIHTVQTEACAPLADAWRAAHGLGVLAGSRWAACMRPWPAVGRSAATGILDDETYDWLGALDAMALGGGDPVVVGEHRVLEANRLASLCGIDADATGTAGLAGLLERRSDVGDGERVAVVFSGVRRGRSG